MKEKNILSQFNNLKTIKADATWKARNRELLLNQISGTQDAENAPAFSWPVYVFNLPLEFAKAMPQSALIAVFALAFVLGGGFFSLQASRDSVPGDSLYVAKIVGEKTQYALTFDEKSKARLGLDFAENRAQELTQVLAENDESEQISHTVEKLVGDFKKEISNAKIRLKKINQDAGNESVIPAVADGGVLAVDDNEKLEEDQVFSANSGKDAKGIEVSDDNTKEVPVEPEETATSSDDSEATTTETDAIEDIPSANPTKIIQQAKNLLRSDDILATMDMIDEANVAIDGVEVKGIDNAEEAEGAAASSSEETE